MSRASEQGIPINWSEDVKKKGYMKSQNASHND